MTEEVFFCTVSLHVKKYSEIGSHNGNFIPVPFVHRIISV